MTLNSNFQNWISLAVAWSQISSNYKNPISVTPLIHYINLEEMRSFLLLLGPFLDCQHQTNICNHL